MKHFTLFLFCLTFLCWSASAQKFLHRSQADSTSPGIERQYEELFGQAKFKQQMQSEGNRFQRQFSKEKILTGADFSTWETKAVVYLHLLINPNGNTDYCIYEVREFDVSTRQRKLVALDSIGDHQKENFGRVIQQVLDQFKWKFELTKPSQFSTAIMPNFGVERKVRTDRISTLEEARLTSMPDTVTRINLSFLDLMEFPQVLYRFKNLKEIDLSKNYLEDLPRDLKKFKKLKVLDISTNDLTDDSFHFKRNKSIRVVNVMQNNLSFMPGNLSKNRKLEDLLIGNNDMEALGKTSFRKFKRLKNLNLYACNLKELPDGISKLKKLEVLDVYHNKLRFLPKELGRLKNLTTLAISNNELWKLPEEINQLTNLSKLYTHHNKLDRLPQLPAGLKLLDIGYNDFKDFPSVISALPHIEELDISFNKLSNLPLELLKMPQLKQVFMSKNEFTLDEKKSADLDALIAELDKKSVKAKR